MIEDIDYENVECLIVLFQVVVVVDEELVLIDMLDGYMIVLICGLVMVLLLQVMDVLFGEDWFVMLDVQDVIEEFMDWLYQCWNEIVVMLDLVVLMVDQEQMLLMFLIIEFDELMKVDLFVQGVLIVEQFEGLFVLGVMWVDGFMCVVYDYEMVWYVYEVGSEQGQMFDVMLMVLVVVVMLIGQQCEVYIVEFYEVEDEVDQNVLFDDVLFFVQDLCLFWLQLVVGDDVVY